MTARRPLRLTPEAARAIRWEVSRAGGREVSFLADVTPDREIVDARAVARGNRSAVLAVADGACEGSIMIHNHPSGLLEPSEADLAVAARIHERGIGTAIVDNSAANIYVVVEPPTPRSIEPLKPRDLSALLGPGGPFSEMDGYEDRRGQRAMTRFVADRFNEGGVGLVEAGTGTGKSLAYLIPAAQWAAQNNERTIVSTNTINLQEQLAGKDLDLADGLLDADLRWALVKGRGNYVSIRRARLAADSAPSLFPDDRSEELAALAEWADRTDDGSLSDLPLPPSPEVWEEVRSETDACLRAKCPHFQQCHYQRSRREAASADILVVNHALFFSDLAIRIAADSFRDSAVLPPYRRVVFDEAHHVEEAATARLGAETTRAGMYRTLNRLDRNGSGVLATVEASLAFSAVSDSARNSGIRITKRVRPRLDGLRAAFDRFFDAMEDWTSIHSRGGDMRLGRPPRPREPAIPEPADDRAVGETLERALIALNDLRRELEDLVDRIDDGDDDLPPDLQGHVLDLGACANRLGSIERALQLCLRPSGGADADMVRWIESRRLRHRRGWSTNLAFLAAPIDLGPTLSDHLFGNVDSAVLTSATMAVDGDFGYMRGRLGLGAARPDLDLLLHDGGGRDDGDGEPDVSEAVFDSPFDYPAQSRLIVPTDLPGPSQYGRAAQYNSATATIVDEVARMSGGGVFCLFTSYAALRAVAAGLRAMGAEARWPLHVQGEADRSALLRRFTRSGSAVLLGTASFWEGVDVPGKPLRAMIIQKLPFRPPTDPVLQARVEAVEARGGNGFWELQVPDAAVRLKQGVGRLIRTRSDRGAVLLLDDRVLTKRYGQTILDSLPPMPLVRGPWRRVREQVAAFYR